MLAVVMLYLSMVLIGQRHWQAREENSLLLSRHYLVRALRSWRWRRSDAVVLQ